MVIFLNALQNLGQVAIKVADSNKVEVLQIIRRLGEGYFGQVNLVQNNSGNKYALKNINLNRLRGDHRLAFLRLILNEVSNLKKLDMLQGFTHNNGQAQILMPFVEGGCVGDLIEGYWGGLAWWSMTIGQWNAAQEGQDSLVEKCFVALGELHRHGIVHGDAHMFNFILRSDGIAVPIDMGLSSTASFFSIIQDYYKFARGFSMAPCDTTAQLVDMYLHTSMNYMLNNKSEAAITCLIYGVFSVATMYGLGVSAAARMMLWMFMKSKAQDMLTNFAFKKLHDWRVQYVFNGLNSWIPLPFIGNPDTSPLVIAGKVALALQIIYNIAIHYETAKEVFAEGKKICKREIEISDIKPDLVLKVMDLALLCYPINRLLHLPTDFYASHVATEKDLLNMCAAVAYPRGMLNRFNIWRGEQAALAPAIAEQPIAATPVLVMH